MGTEVIVQHQWLSNERAIIAMKAECASMALCQARAVPPTQPPGTRPGRGARRGYQDDDIITDATTLDCPPARPPASHVPACTCKVHAPSSD